jgi:hypothetical protein
MSERVIRALLGAPKYDELRRSDNIEDRRKEHFNSFPQPFQPMNVFAPEGLMTNLDWRRDFAPMQNTPTPLSQQAGANSLDDLLKLYYAQRGSNLDWN